MESPDLLRAASEPARTVVLAALAGAVPAPVLAAAGELVVAAAVVALAAVLAALGTAIQRPEVAGERRPARIPLVVSAVLATALLAWIVRHPSEQLHEMFGRGDHLAFAVLAGLAIRGAPRAARPWLVAAVSVVILVRYSGPVAVAVALAAALLGFVTLRVSGGTRPWPVVLVHAVIGAGVYAFCWRMRGPNLFQALHTYGLFSFLFLRQISYAVSACRGGGGPLGSYLCYVSFYPGASGPLGAPEVYDEFARRNLRGEARPDHAWGLRKVVHGMAQIWLADRIPMTAADVFASPTTLLAWTRSLVFFVEVALRVMGYWALIDATAAFFGFRLRQNFAAILTCRNPSDLWRSWRGTLTNWLITHVYAPLGANRRHQALNILAAFGVSLLWHWAGVPFLAADFRLAHLGPITLWAVVNALAVIAHVYMVRHRRRLLPGATPEPLRQGLHIFLTLCLGTLSVTLPHLQLGAHQHFGPFVRRLLGVEGW